MKAWVIGFDLSLTAPAAVALPLDWRPGNWKSVQAWLIKPESPKQDDLVGQMKRYIAISNWACGVVMHCCKDTKGVLPTVFVEAYGFSKNNSQASKIMESGGVVRVALYKEHGVTMTTVAANTGRKLFMGKCPQKDPKLHVQHALFNTCKAPKSWDENQADAFVVANWGLSEAGGRCLSLAR